MPCWDANEGILQGGAHSSDRVEISLENTMPAFAQTFLGCAAAGSTLKCILWYSLCFFPFAFNPITAVGVYVGLSGSVLQYSGGH